MNIFIKEVTDDEICTVKEFLYNQIEKEYGIGPTMEFHFDIEGLKEYYMVPERNNFFVAYNGDVIVATAAIRAYDRNYKFFNGIYSDKDTASIWRLMVDKSHRRQGLARLLVGHIEDFARNKGYSKIYLHTHRYLDAAISFWKSLGYKVTIEEDDYDETSHMIKYLF